MRELSKKNYALIAISFTVILFLTIVIFLLLFKPYPLKYTENIVSAAQKYGVKPDIIASVIYAESGFDSNVQSSKGAIGLMQILPSTAEWLAVLMKVDYQREMLFDPEYNINMGTYYLSYLFRKFNDFQTVLASYNAGEGNVKLWLLSSKYSSDGATIITTPYKQTNHYIDKTFDAYNYYKEVFVEEPN